MSIAVGLAGVKHDASVALATDREVLAAAPQERITRVRSAGFGSTGFPDDVLDALLAYSGHQRGDVRAYAVAEDATMPPGLPVARIEHHRAHALASFLPSPFESAAIVICDQDAPEVSVWNGVGEEIARVEWAWHGPGPARVHSECARVLGFSSGRADQRLDAVARLAAGYRDARADALMSFAGDRLRLAPDWHDALAAMAHPGAHPLGGVAAAVQTRLADVVLDLLADVKKRLPERTRLCLGTVSSTAASSTVPSSELVSSTGLRFHHPGNAGLAIGNALYAGGGGRTSLSPFLGPGYTSEEVKAALDNCKLTYEWVSEDEAIAAAVKDLRYGRLVAWFDGRMEWGPRALGARSILANPFAPYTLENLNRFLKQREPWRGYALSGLSSTVAEHFDGPSSSPFMECDYVPRDPKRFEHILPSATSGVRVQTVDEASGLPRFCKLLNAFGEEQQERRFW
ncbi:MAG: carbamoyltransferase C-terminal domain-containing protein [Vicinamibacterales bacterium]